MRRDFVRRPLLQETADTGVHIFRVFADDDEVEVFRALVAKRRRDAREQLNGTQINILIEFETQAEQEALFEDARLHVDVPDRAQKNRAKLAQLFDFVVGDDNPAVFQVAFAANVEIGQFELDIFKFRNFFQDFNRFADHFRPGSVAAEGRHFQHIVHYSSPQFRSVRRRVSFGKISLVSPRFYRKPSTFRVFRRFSRSKFPERLAGKRKKNGTRKKTLNLNPFIMTRRAILTSPPTRFLPTFAETARRSRQNRLKR